jgi:uncharacterized membrane protein YebE (DUF533 family)
MTAPRRRRMKEACTQAAEHYRREHLEHDQAETRISITVDRVPHLAPAVGDTPDWYKVGSLLVEPDHLMLNVYLDSSSDAVKLEQALEDVVPNDEAPSPGQ